MSVHLHVAIECDGCHDRVDSDLNREAVNFSQLYHQAKERARALKWVEKNEGRNAKHYCPDCLGSIPAIARWHMKRILTRP